MSEVMKKKYCRNCGAPVEGKFCSECGTKVEDVATVNDIEPTSKSESVKGKRFEGKKIIGLKYHRSGMSMGKYLTIMPMGDGYDVIEGTKDTYWPEMGSDNLNLGMSMMGMAGMMGIMPGIAPAPSNSDLGMESKINVSKEETEQFFEALIEAKITSWDGYSESRSLGPGVLDGDDSFDLKLMFEDKEVMKACGRNTYPDNYKTIVGLISQFFANHTDYSKYYPTTFPKEAPRSFTLSLGSNINDDIRFSIDLTNDKLIVNVIDKIGLYFEKGFSSVKILENGNHEERISKFFALLEKYDYGKLNQKMETVMYNEDVKPLHVYTHWTGNRSYQINIGISLTDNKAFVDDLVEEIMVYMDK